MRFDWQQLSPGEREALLRHFLLNKKNAPVTAERVCAAMQKTHYMSCHTTAEGKTVIQFVTTAPRPIGESSAKSTLAGPTRAGVSLSDDVAEGIYKAALRAKGVQVDDGIGMAMAGSAIVSSKAPARAGR
jgi:hypothetical protein